MDAILIFIRNDLEHGKLYPVYPQFLSYYIKLVNPKYAPNISIMNNNTIEIIIYS